MPGEAGLRKFVVLIAFGMLAACAKAPDAIQASYTSDYTYQPLSCQQLAGEQARVQDALNRASAQQSQARTNDVVGVLLIGLPVSSLSGDNVAPEVAKLKGDLEALHRVQLAKNCPMGTPAVAAKG